MEFLRRNIRLIGAFALAAFLVAGFIFFFAPPPDFPSGTLITVTRGTPSSDIADTFARAHLVKHPAALSFVLRATGAASRVQAGAYLFKTPENALTIAYRLATGAYGIPPVRITFPEGITVREMAAKAEGSFPLISADEIISLGKPQEGFLFPDTYLFDPGTSAATILAALRANFDAKTAPLSEEIRASGHSLRDVVIMASLLEKEVRTTGNRKIVSGILWDRLELGMPLQVDAVFGYIYGRDTYSPSLADLKVNSPYNTYTHKGLPPGPIDNPGMDSIQAALHPTKSKYLYYLTDAEGNIHYAATYAEHQLNQKKYLH